MKPHFHEFINFVKTFFRYLNVMREFILGIVLTITAGGFLLSTVEKIPLGDGVYFAFITGLTIGYGDITPKTLIGRIICVLLGVVGLIFAGVLVAIANRALADTTRKSAELRHILEQK